MIALLQDSILTHASQSPNREAFRCRSDSLTYENLKIRCGQLANTLQSLGIKNMDRVGVFMGKSIEMPIATYGILMAGGAYVPIDPNAPTGRIEFILKNCGIRIVITNKSKFSALEKVLASCPSQLTHVIGLPENSLTGVETLNWDTIGKAEPSPPFTNSREDDLAYVMYTSGSTGTPKGLMHTHRSGLAYARHSADLYGVNNKDVLGNHAPLHFDISTFEFLTGPYAGATSVLIPEEQIMFPVSLAQFIAEEQLTFFYSVPLALIQLCTQANLSELNFPKLRWILFGGEPIPPKILERITKQLPNTQFCNVYGPAEVNQCTYYHIPKDFSDTDNPVPIGQIWNGARGIIIDDEGNTASPEAPGELLISSATSMQGYWGRDDLNESAFHYEEPVPGLKQKYYRTGDLVQKDINGILHFLGRKDRQVKLRGYRIELDEIEAALLSHECVEEAAVLLVKQSEDEKELIALITISENFEYQKKSVYSHIQNKLPTYALPSTIKVSHSFPRTTSGKIDRTTLTKNFNEKLDSPESLAK